MSCEHLANAGDPQAQTNDGCVNDTGLSHIPRA